MSFIKKRRKSNNKNEKSKFPYVKDSNLAKALTQC
jgi:hypothetical protein